jgi:hypothetical protein
MSMSGNFSEQCINLQFLLQLKKTDTKSYEVASEESAVFKEWVFEEQK